MFKVNINNINKLNVNKIRYMNSTIVLFVFRNLISWLAQAKLRKFEAEVQ